MAIINVEKIENKVKEWIFTVALKKAIIRLAQLIVSWAVANKIVFKAVIFGIPIDLSNVEVMTGALMMLSEILRNWLKIKFPKYFGWL